MKENKPHGHQAESHDLHQQPERQGEEGRCVRALMPRVELNQLPLGGFVWGLWVASSRSLTMAVLEVLPAAEMMLCLDGFCSGLKCE